MEPGWTNEAHSLIWSDITLTQSGSLVVLKLEHGAAFWVNATYSYLLLLFGTVMLADVLLPSLRLYWQQAMALLLSALIPWVASVAFLTGVNPISPLDPVPFAFIFSGLALFWAVARFRFLDLGPVARNRMFTDMSAGVLVLDTENRIADCNTAALWIIGVSLKQALGQPLSKVWPHDSDLVDAVATGLSEYQEIFVNRGAEARTYDVAMWPLIDGSGRLTGRILLFSNTTERKQLENQLFQAARLSELGQLTAGIAHEMNNPLGVIMTHAEVLMRSELDETSRADLEVIYREAEQGLQVVRKLLSYSRQQVLEKRYLSVNEIVESMLELRSFEIDRSNIRLEKQLQLNLPKTMVDANQIQQVFSNLMINAEHAMHAACIDGTLQIITVQADNRIRIIFKDDGPGIPAEHLAKVFTPFFTTKEVGEGTGLGLSICDGIIKRHGGRIYVESGPGEGATFTVELPLTDRHGATVPQAVPGGPADAEVGPQVDLEDDGMSRR